MKKLLSHVALLLNLGSTLAQFSVLQIILQPWLQLKELMLVHPRFVNVRCAPPLARVLVFLEPPFRKPHLYRLQLARLEPTRALFPKLRWVQAPLLPLLQSPILPLPEKQRRLIVPLHRLIPPLLPPQTLVVPVAFVINRVGMTIVRTPCPTTTHHFYGPPTIFVIVANKPR